MTEILDDLVAEHASLDELAAGADLDEPTPAAGWTIGDTLGHLWYFDRAAVTALVDKDGFDAILKQAIADPDAYRAESETAHREYGERLPDVARTTRAELIDALRASDPTTKVPWYGPPMSPASFATARLMEYWAHGQDIADALAVKREPTTRLRHICHLGVRTRNFSYVVRGMTPPDAEVFVALNGPDGSQWSWGPDEAADRIEGDALDFCLVVTQRRPLETTGLRVTGPLAVEWMSIAQAFAGDATLTDDARRDL